MSFDHKKGTIFGIIELIANEKYVRDVLSTSKLPLDILASLEPGYAIMSAKIEKILNSARNRHACQ